jgi:hypothetical protein
MEWAAALRRPPIRSPAASPMDRPAEGHERAFNNKDEPGQTGHDADPVDSTGRCGQAEQEHRKNDRRDSRSQESQASAPLSGH